MIVIISDLHLTDGTSGATITSGAFRLFAQEVSDLAYDASWRADGKYRPIEEVHLVLLGDILDVIRSTKWLKEDGKVSTVRPWDDPSSDAFVGKVRSINEAILTRNAASLGELKKLKDSGALTIPPATSDGKPAEVSRDPADPRRLPVKLHLYYIVGNHDWFYHLPGEAHNQIRKTVVDTMGLDNDPNQPFAHDPGEWPLLQRLYEDHRIFARHGDIYDPSNFDGDRNRSSLGDAVVVELVDRFALQVLEDLGNQLSAELVAGLKEIDNVRPLARVPVWIHGLVDRTCPNAEIAKSVKRVWNELAESFVHLPFVRQHPKAHLMDWVLDLSRNFSFETLSHLVTKLGNISSRDQPSFTDALRETAFLNRTARFIVFGHTHAYEVVPLDSVSQAQGILNQIYINSGTWRAVREAVQVHPEQHRFVGYQVMTYLAFFKDDERNGRLFESWSGHLGEPKGGIAG